MPVGESRWRGPSRPVAVHKRLPQPLQRVSAVSLHTHQDCARLRCLCQLALTHRTNGYRVVSQNNPNANHAAPLCVCSKALPHKQTTTPSKVVCSGPQPTNQPTKTCAACGPRQGCAPPLLLLQALLQANRHAQPQHCCRKAHPCTYDSLPDKPHMRALPERQAHFPACCAHLLPPYARHAYSS